MKNLVQYEIPNFNKIRTNSFTVYFLLGALIILFTQCSDNDPMDLEPEVDLCAGIECGENSDCIDGSCVCEEDYFGENCEKKKGLLKSISRDGKLRYEMEYSQDLLLKSMKLYSLDGESIFYTYECSWFGDTIRVDLQEIPDFQMFFYVENENQLIREEIFQDVLESRYVMIYNNCGISQELRYDTNGELKETTNYEFVDDQCSFTQIDGNSKITVLMDANNGIFSFDENAGFGLNNSLIDYQLESKGNVIQRTVEIDNVIQESQSFTAEYQFNDHGFPIENTRTYLDGDMEVYTYTYWD